MPIYAFVDAPSDSPTILLDLDDQNPLKVVEATKTSPPQRRVSAFGSSAQDGDVIAAKSYPNRQLTIKIDFAQGSTAEEQSEAIQKLARLLDGEAWLQWQHDAKIEPVFYRTLYGDIDVDDEIVDETPMRYVTLSITAEPFSRGLPVTGTATITNDPTTGTNKMSLVMPDIQGDVATPLWLDWPHSVGIGNNSAKAVISTCAGDVTPTSPPYSIGNTSASNNVTGWSSADSANSAFWNGTRRRFTKASGTLVNPVSAAKTMTFAPGNYRVFARCIAPANSTIQLFTGGGTVKLSYTVPSTSPNEMALYDMGVVRLPFNQPMMDPATDLVPAFSASFYFGVGLSTGTGTIDWDGGLFVPVGLDEGVSASWGGTIFSTPLTGVTYHGIADGINKMAYSKYDAGLGDQAAGMLVLDGGFPIVVPGVKNVLTILPTVFPSATTAEPDSKTRTTVVTWKYFPPYLYDRPASS